MSINKPTKQPTKTDFTVDPQDLLLFFARFYLVLLRAAHPYSVR